MPVLWGSVLSEASDTHSPSSKRGKAGDPHVRCGQNRVSSGKPESLTLLPRQEGPQLGTPLSRERWDRELVRGQKGLLPLPALHDSGVMRWLPEASAGQRAAVRAE